MVFFGLAMLLIHGGVSSLSVDGEIPQTKMEVIAAAAPQDEQPSLRVEEFFWTGSGDGPAAPPDPPPRPTPAAATVVRTTTVLATLYLDNSQPPQAVTDRTTGDCILNCDVGGGGGGFPDSLQPAEAAVPGDQRYWLLTVVRGGTPDALQLRLARLYQKAFLRQQERHLGIVKSLDAPTTRKKHDVHSFEVTKVNGSQKGHPQRYHNIQGSMVVSPAVYSRIPDSTPDLNITSSFSISLSSIAPSMTQFSINMSEPETVANIIATKLSEVGEMWILATPDASLVKRDIVADQGDMIEEEYSEKMIEFALEEENNNTSGIFKREIIKPEQQPPVQVYIQNVTESPDTQNVEIVYVVLVGGRAVPAAVAARDMRLVRDAEVASELGYPVTTKAEPYLKAAEGLEGGGEGGGARGSEVWALAGGALAAAVLLLLLLALLCRLARRKKSMSAAALHSYRSELMRQAERNQLRQVHEEKDGRLISVVSPSRARTNNVLPHRRDTSSSSSTSSGVSEVAEALRRRQRRGQRAAQRGLRLPHKRVGATDSLLASAGLSESSSAGSARAPSAPATPVSYLSMPSVKAFPRGNAVEPLTRVLEPVSVRHLDLDSPLRSPEPRRRADPESAGAAAPRRQMAAQLVRVGSMDKDPGVVGPLVWDLHCQRVKESAVPRGAEGARTAAATVREGGNISRMRQRFNELVDDAFSLFSSPGSSPGRARAVGDAAEAGAEGATEVSALAQARNDNVRLPGFPYTALDTVRGRSANVRPTTSSATFGAMSGAGGGGGARPLTSAPRRPALERRVPPARAWDTPSPQMVYMGAVPRRPVVNPHVVLAEGHLPPADPALPLISAIKSEIQRVRDANMPH